MSDHTPGPWEYRLYGRGVVFAVTGEYDDKQIRASVSLSSAFKPTVSLDSVLDSETLDATGYLIAAAPDLLEVCEAIMDLGDDFKDEWLGTWLTVRDALNKANGGTP